MELGRAICPQPTSLCTCFPATSTQTPLSSRLAGEGASFALPLPKFPAARIMKEEEPSPSLQCCVLKDVSNRTDFGRRPCGWRRRLLVVGQYESDEGIHSSGSLASSCGSQENAASNVSDSSKKSSAESAFWDGHRGLEGASVLDSTSTTGSDDGFVSSLEDSFQERESQLPHSYDKLFNSPLFHTSMPTSCASDKENVPNTDSNLTGHVPQLACSSAQEAAAATPGTFGLLEHPANSLLGVCLQSSAFKRPVSPGDQLSPPLQKRSKGSLLQRVTSYTEPSCSLKVINFTRSLSDTDASIKSALQKSAEHPDLIGDFTKPYALPLVKGKHHDLKMILPSTLADLLQGKYVSVVDEVTVIDCRYPFEYKGGHIKGAINVYRSEHLMSEFLEKSTSTSDSRRVLVFHCEFSSERGPKLSRLLRERDRQIHINQYPALKHPEIYVLEGGYKAFYEEFQDLCTPQGYVPMRHKDHEADLRLYRGMAKTEGSAGKSRSGLQIRALKNF
ncbi:M-phase inducer phosphatase 1 isoform X2 [Dermacentor silvarum]|uniref:M-phase inducer phosphatase 1 isoform X2 n=1 Tax=Dermacentor silvarum TaxID=543639 RepID=UPI0018976777|nr:M-phase inducer phosphatase 1 isoform X2 [Dermacentor silvarum]